VKESVSEADYKTMTDAEIALAVHDYLALHMRYHHAGASNPASYPDAYNIYGAVVNGSAVCQGYALAYQELLHANDITAGIVTSDQANHAWNVVETEGGFYHVDVTFDDPTILSPDEDKDISGFVRHDFFMLTDAQIIAEDEKHDRSDMLYDSAIETALTAHPDSALWQDAYTMFYCGDGQWLRLKDYTRMGGVIANLTPTTAGADICSLADTKGEEIYAYNTFPLYGLMARLDDTLYYNAFPYGAKSGEIRALDISTFEEETVLTLPEGHIAEEPEEKDGKIYYLDIWYESGEAKYERKELELGGGETPELPADLTGDGVMDLLDAIALAKHLAGLSSISNSTLTAAGFVPDGIDVGDVVSILAGA